MADKALLILEKRQVIDVAAREYVPPVELRRTIFGTNVVSVLGSTEITLGICICMRIGVIGDNRGVSRETLLQLRLQRVVIGAEDWGEDVDRVVSLIGSNRIYPLRSCCRVWGR